MKFTIHGYGKKKKNRTCFIQQLWEQWYIFIFFAKDNLKMKALRLHLKVCSLQSQGTV